VSQHDILNVVFPSPIAGYLSPRLI